MPHIINDIFPSSSGAASIGVSQIGIGNNVGFTTDIRPFAHIHLNSGVFHNEHGSSGIIRFNQQAGRFEGSIDGGLTFQSIGGSSSTSLQGAYNTDTHIFLTRTGDDNLDIVAVDGKTRFSRAPAGGSVPAPINISGALGIANGSLEVGDINMYHHSMVLNNGTFTAPTTTDESTARSLGIGTLSLNTGSGIINVSVGSGIFQVAYIFGLRAFTKPPSK